MLLYRNPWLTQKRKGGKDSERGEERMEGERERRMEGDGRREREE